MGASAAVRLFLEAVWSEGDLDLVDELFGSEHVGHPSGPDAPVRGPRGVMKEDA